MDNRIPSRRFRAVLDDGRTLEGVATLRHEMNQSRINRARGIRLTDGYQTEAGSVLAWCVVTDNGNREGTPTLDEWLNLDTSPVQRIVVDEVDHDADEVGRLGESTQTAPSTV